MPTIYIIYSYILYITSLDSGEPFHIHVVSREFMDFNREPHSAKIWLGKFGEAEIAGNKGKIDLKELNNIVKNLKTRKDIYDRAVAVWCKLFGVKPSEIDFYKNFKK